MPHRARHGQTSRFLMSLPRYFFAWLAFRRTEFQNSRGRPSLITSRSLLSGTVRGLECEGNLLRLLRRDSHGLVLHPVFFLPGFHGVRTGREISDFELAAFVCHCVI